MVGCYHSELVASHSVRSIRKGLGDLRSGYLFKVEILPLFLTVENLCHFIKKMAVLLQRDIFFLYLALLFTFILRYSLS